MKTLNIGISTCPNDTFIFAAMLGGLIPSPFSFNVTMDDVEQLNNFILHNKPDISKISYGVAADIMDRYALLPAGGALGFGCGPLLVANPDVKFGKIAVPGMKTTAYKVLQLFYPELVEFCEPMRFDQIMPLVQSGKYAMGLVIHEGRFTYGNYGLQKVADLGELWQGRFNSPLPLGCIAIRREFADIAPAVNTLIRQSLEYAWENPQNVMDFVKKYSDEMDDDVMLRHIELYVNEFSLDATPALDGIAEFLGVSADRVFCTLGEST